jgi:hypothetical protein
VSESYVAPEGGGSDSIGTLANELADKRRSQNPTHVPEPAPSPAPLLERAVAELHEKPKTYREGPEGIREAAEDLRKGRRAPKLRSTGDDGIDAAAAAITRGESILDEIKVRPEADDLLRDNANRGDNPGDDPAKAAELLALYRQQRNALLNSALDPEAQEAPAGATMTDDEAVAHMQAAMERNGHVEPVAEQPAPDPLADERRAVTEHAAALRTELDNTKALSRSFLETATATAQKSVLNLIAAYPESATQAGMAKLAMANPARFAQYVEDRSYVERTIEGAQGAERALKLVGSRVAEEQKRDFQTFAVQQDKLAEDGIPELKNATPSQKHAVAGRVMDAFHSIGVSPNEVMQMYHSNRDFRSAAGQKLVLEWATNRAELVQLKTEKAAATKQLRERRSTPIPQVQRPGVARPRGADDAEEVNRLNRRLEKSGSMEDGVALLAARRRARG